MTEVAAPVVGPVALGPATGRTPAGPAESVTGSALRTIGFASAVRGGSLALGAGLGLATAVVLVRSLGVAGYGRVAFALTLATAVGGLADFGVSTAVTRDGGLPEGVARGWARTGVPVSLVSGSLAAAIVASAAAVLPSSTGRALWAAVPLAGLRPLHQTMAGALMARRRIIRVEGSYVLKAALTLVAIVVVDAAGRLDAERAVWIQVLASLSATAVLLPAWPDATRTTARSSPAALLRFAVPLGLSLLAWSALQHSDVILLGLIRGTGGVGRYAPLLQVGGMTDLLLGVIAAYYLPVVTPTLAAGRFRDAGAIFVTVGRWGIVAATPLLAPLILCPGPLLQMLFGRQFSGLAGPARLLAVGYLANAVTGFNSRSLVALGAVRAIAVRSIVVVILILALNAALIPRFGLVGAAAGTMVGYLGLNVANAILLARRTGITPVVPAMLSTVAGGAAGTALAGGLLLATGHLAARWAPFLVALVATAGSAYAAFLTRQPADAEIWAHLRRRWAR